jgi:class 3 adenylate cyclase
MDEHEDLASPESRAIPLRSESSLPKAQIDWRAPFTIEVDELFTRRLRVATTVLMALHLVAILVFDDKAGGRLGFALKIALIPFTALLFASTFWGPTKRLVRTLSATMITVVAAFAAWTNATGGDPLDTRALTLTILAAGLLFPFDAFAMLALSACVLALYFLAARGAPGATPQTIAAGTFFLVGASSLATVAALLSSRLREREFRARHQTETLLRNMLPEAIVGRLKAEGGSVADRHPEATVMFADIVGFTSMSAAQSPETLVRFLNELFSKIDALTTKHGLEKIKTIGDAYMVAGGLPAPRADHAEAVARLAIEVRELVAGLATPDGKKLVVRIGIHTGPVIAGVIGATKLTYDLWGDTVNTASRMESHGEPGMIQVTEATYERLRATFVLEPRGSIQVKGKGAMNAFALVGSREKEA